MFLSYLWNTSSKVLSSGAIFNNLFAAGFINAILPSLLKTTIPSVVCNTIFPISICSVDFSSSLLFRYLFSGYTITFDIYIAKAIAIPTNIILQIISIPSTSFDKSCISKSTSLKVVTSSVSI